MLSILLTGLGLGIFVLLSWLHRVSVTEHEPLAARRGLIAALLLPLPYLALAWLPIPGAGVAGWILAAVTVGAPLVLAVPTGRPHGFEDSDPTVRVDERTVMFSRAVLEPGDERFETYYRDHPEHRAADDRFRALPGLQSPSAGKYEPLAFAASGASFTAVEHLAGLVEGEPAPDRVDVDPDTATRFFRGWARKLGAVDCGVAELRDEHFYSIKGRGEKWGREILPDHPRAIAFTVEMDHRQLGQAPEAPTLMESAQQYLESGRIAVQIAECIRRLGWNAEAHIDANYRVICPLVARDAGLGEIGRMGLLMTPRLGPRVRIAVVTTDLPLRTNERRADPALLHFCSLCRKCADICPVQAVPAGPREHTGGALRWKIDDEACFSYWCATGTDCGQCMRICPYSHPDSALHNIVRAGLGNSSLFRRFALRMDDLLYGRRPALLRRPDWLPGRRRRRGDSGTTQETGRA